MNRIIALLLALSCGTTLAENTDKSPTYKTSDTQSITAKNGQIITVRGTVSTVRKSKSGTNFINFVSSEFYLVAFKSDLETFETGEPVDLYQGKHLAVTGVISIYKDKPQMKITRPDMVRIISEDAPIPTLKKRKTRKVSSQKPVAKTSVKTAPDKKKKTSPVDPKKYFK